jgi:serine/threonine protein kinase
MGLIRRLAVQLLYCLKFLKQHKIIHCDLKPENILLKHPNKAGIKVIDFGSACFEDEKIYTYIQSRFYRAPEIMLGISYTEAIDMWSLGCILAELYSGYPLFPGENEVEQLACIMEIKGLPPQELLDNASRKRIFFNPDDTLKLVTNSRGKRRYPGSRTLNEKLKVSDSTFLDFIERCLEWIPSQRWSPEEALRHDWIQEIFTKTSTDRKQLKSARPQAEG